MFVAGCLTRPASLARSSSGEGRCDLGRSNGVFSIGDDGRAGEQARNVRDIGFLQSELGKAVLCDLDLAASLLDLHAQVSERSDGQAGIVRDDDRSSAREGFLERGDDFTLFRSFQS